MRPEGFPGDVSEVGEREVVRFWSPVVVVGWIELGVGKGDRGMRSPKGGRRRAGSGQGLGRRNGFLCAGFDLCVNRRNWVEVAHQGWLGLEERMAFFVRLWVGRVCGVGEMRG